MKQEKPGLKPVRKFLFDNDFDAGNEMPARNVVRKKVEAPAEPPPPPPPPPPPEPTFSEAELAAAVAEAKAKALKDGQAKGKADAQAQIEAQIANVLGNIGSQIATMTAALAQDRSVILGEAAGLAMAMMRKMLPEFTQRGGLVEVEAIIERCLIDQRREKRLNIRVPADLLPALQAKIAELAAEKHFEGRVNLIADAALQPASCQIEWADGGLERNGEAIWRDVSAALDRCLTTQGIEAVTVADETTTEPASDMPGDTVGSTQAGD
ncbi:FliH/SctL family protein [Dongia rigui]|uniref:FliH/SctL family protein n=1 Tax=Dongia rigui TaxID=940149 RepID=A0ABU5DUA8_9PROT|nr:FliH/SctL family protein [Dongia rigui]MDY0870562.1 FliH/SctL family protein [Dongia rigui]